MYKYTRKEIAKELEGYGSIERCIKLLLAKQEDKKEWIRCEKCGEHINFKITPTPSPLDLIEGIEEFCQNRLLWKYIETESIIETINSLIRNQTKIINYLKGKK